MKSISRWILAAGSLSLVLTSVALAEVTLSPNTRCNSAQYTEHLLTRAGETMLMLPKERQLYWVDELKKLMHSTDVQGAARILRDVTREFDQFSEKDQARGWISQISSPTRKSVLSNEHSSAAFDPILSSVGATTSGARSMSQILEEARKEVLVEHAKASSTLPASVQADALKIEIVRAYERNEFDRVLMGADRYSDLAILGEQTPPAVLHAAAKAANSCYLRLEAFEFLTAFLKVETRGSAAYSEAISNLDDYRRRAEAVE